MPALPGLDATTNTLSSAALPAIRGTGKSDDCTACVRYADDAASTVQPGKRANFTSDSQFWKVVSAGGAQTGTRQNQLLKLAQRGQSRRQDPGHFGIIGQVEPLQTGESPQDGRDGTGQLVPRHRQQPQPGQIAEFGGNPTGQLIHAEVETFQAGQGSQSRWDSSRQPVPPEIQVYQRG